MVEVWSTQLTEPESIEQPQEDRREEVCGDNAQPHGPLEHAHELEQRGGRVRSAHEYCRADQVIVGHGEIHIVLAFGHHRQRTQCDVGVL
jgi:hypothetical protein